MKAKTFLVVSCIIMFLYQLPGCKKDDSEKIGPGNPVQIADEILIRKTFFDYFQDSIQLTIISFSEHEVVWSISHEYDYLTIIPASGSIEKNDSTSIMLYINRSLLGSENSILEINLTTLHGQQFVTSIEVMQYSKMDWLIEGEIVAAAFCRTSGNLVLAMTSPQQLQIYNLINLTTNTVSLALPPTSISIGMDGLHAVVGHDAWFSYIYLASMEVANVYPVTTHVHDIILGPNNWVYAFPKTDNLGIRCVELATGYETRHQGTSHSSSGTQAVLHTSGQYMYGATNSSSYLNFVRYNIDTDTAVFAYPAPLSVHYTFIGKVWLSDNGEKLFARGRNVFNSSPEREGDMTYAGQLPGHRFLVTLDYSTAANRIYAVLNESSGYSSPENRIHIYEADYINYIKTIPIPSIIIPDGSGGAIFYEARGHYGYFNQDGSKYYIVSKAVSAPENYWSISTIDVE